MTFSTLATSEDIAKPICEALGIDASKVERLTIDLKSGNAAIIQVTYFIDPKDKNNVIDKFKKYSLVETPI